MYAKDKTTILDRREMLRVKIKSLAEEARIIRREERRSFGVLREELHRHRVLEVRRAARHAHLAYGLIRGRSVGDMEPFSYVEPDMDEITRLIKKYGPPAAAKAKRVAKPEEAAAAT